jgi:hypothetical protein
MGVMRRRRPILHVTIVVALVVGSVAALAALLMRSPRTSQHEPTPEPMNATEVYLACLKYIIGMPGARSHLTDRAPTELVVEAETASIHSMYLRDDLDAERRDLLRACPTVSEAMWASLVQSNSGDERVRLQPTTIDGIQISVLENESYGKIWVRGASVDAGWAVFWQRHGGALGLFSLSLPVFSDDRQQSLVFVKCERSGEDGWGKFLCLRRGLDGWSVTAEYLAWVS